MIFSGVDCLWSSQYNWRPWWKLPAWSRPNRRNFQMTWFLSRPRDGWSSPLPPHSHHVWCTVDLLNTEFCTGHHGLICFTKSADAEQNQFDLMIPCAEACLSLPCMWWLPGSCQRTLQLQLQWSWRSRDYLQYLLSIWHSDYSLP